MSLEERPPDPEASHGRAGALKRALLGVGAPLVAELTAGVVIIAMMVLVLPLAAAVFVVTSLLFYGVLMLLGTPEGAFGAALGLTWFGGSLALIGWLCILGWRRLGSIRGIAGIPSDPVDDKPASTPAAARTSAPEKDTDADMLRLNGRPVPWVRRTPGRRK